MEAGLEAIAGWFHCWPCQVASAAQRSAARRACQSTGAWSNYLCGWQGTVLEPRTSIQTK
eukprot:2262596-Amphidinium_carterae.1